MQDNAGMPRRHSKSISKVDRLRYLIARVLGSKVARLDDVVLWTDPASVPYEVRRAIFLRSYEIQERALIRAALSPEDRVLDLGSCIGLTAIISAKIVGGESVVTYEANPTLEPIIRRNFTLNGVQPILRMRAVTSDGRDTTLHIGNRAFSSSLFVRDAPRSVVVPSDPISSAISEFRPTVISMDVEGAESELLAGTDLPGVSKVMIEFHPGIIGDEAIARCKQHLGEIGFRLTEQMDDVALFLRQG